MLTILGKDLKVVIISMHNEENCPQNELKEKKLAEKYKRFFFDCFFCFVFCFFFLRERGRGAEEERILSRLHAGARSHNLGIMT